MLPKEHDQPFVKTAEAIEEFMTLLTSKRVVTFKEIEGIAHKHSIPTAHILTHAKLDGGCSIDYTRKVVRCQ